MCLNTCFLAPLSVIPKRKPIAKTCRSRRIRITTPSAVLPVFADVEGAVNAATTAASDTVTSVVESDAADPILNNLARLTFGLAIFCTVGIIILSIDEWRKGDNSRRQIREWEEAGGAKRPRDGTAKDLKSILGIENKNAPPGSKDGNNRQTRRMKKKIEAYERKMKLADEKAQKAKDEQAAKKKK